MYASACAGDSGFGSSRRSWIPSRICLMVMAGLQASSSFKIDRQTVPEGYTFGWKRGGTNLPVTVSGYPPTGSPHNSSRGHGGSASCSQHGETGRRTFGGLCRIFYHKKMRQSLASNATEHKENIDRYSPSGKMTSSLNRPPSQIV